MEKYAKIQTVFKRDMENNGRIIEGDYSMPEFEYLRHNQWIWTEKVDGTNIRVHWRAGSGTKTGGRTDNAQIPTFLYDRIQELLPAEKFESNIDKASELTLYGEGYGARIQKGGGNYIPDGVSFVLFDVLVDGYWLKREDAEDVSTRLGIDIVPVVGEGTLWEGVETVRKGLKSVWGDFKAEGIVMRPSVELKSRMGDRIITKIKYRDFAV